MSKMPSFEVNFDGLVGPSHNYAGLSYGNLASTSNEGSISNPKEAALQGLEKMKTLMDLGLPQAVLAPLQRPDIGLLRTLGFTGDIKNILRRAQKEAPQILVPSFSASSMWAANAATVSPSADTEDGKVHFTPANLISTFHRSLESKDTFRLLNLIFEDQKHFTVHEPLPATPSLGDEGAANHTRFCVDHSLPGVELFTYGREALSASTKSPKQFPARQSLEASQSVARRHLVKNLQFMFVKQNPLAIDKGAFHNDVVAVGHRQILFYHEQAFEDEETLLTTLNENFLEVAHSNLHFVKVLQKQVSLEEAVSSYLFNSQLVTLPDGQVALIAPQECTEVKSVEKYLADVQTHSNGVISKVIFVEVRQSMRNGGGPACLRLRVALTEKELKAVNQNFILSQHLYDELKTWIKSSYRDRLSAKDLADEGFVQEVNKALSLLGKILKIEKFYKFD